MSDTSAQTAWEAWSDTNRLEHDPEGPVHLGFVAGYVQALLDAADVWDEGHVTGFKDCSLYLAAVESNQYPRPSDTPNPYRARAADAGGSDE